MALRFITIAELQAHCVADGDDQEGLEAKGEAAEHIAEMVMNRAIFDTPESLEQARAGVAAALATAKQEYDAGVIDAEGDVDLLTFNNLQYQSARAAAFRIAHGTVITPDVRGGILMLAAHLWTNRADVAEGNINRVPQNSMDIFRRHRYLEGTY